MRSALNPAHFVTALCWIFSTYSTVKSGPKSSPFCHSTLLDFYYLFVSDFYGRFSQSIFSPIRTQKCARFAPNLPCKTAIFKGQKCPVFKPKLPSIQRTKSSNFSPIQRTKLSSFQPNSDTKIRPFLRPFPKQFYGRVWAQSQPEFGLKVNLFKGPITVCFCLKDSYLVNE